MNADGLPRYLRTVAHLTPAQLAWRLWFRFRKRHPGRFITRPGATPRLHPGALTFPLPPAPPYGGLAPADVLRALERGDFARLRLPAQPAHGPLDWRLGKQPADRLAILRLHLHGWLCAAAEANGTQARGRPGKNDLIEHTLSDWMQRCDISVPGAVDLAWNSYAIATRLANWVRIYRALGPAYWQERREFHAAFLRSFHTQAAFLARHIEWDLRGNHLLKDAAGLAWAARFLDGPAPAAWGRAAERLAAPRRLAEQVGPDGGHIERSPMYHVHVMEDLLALAMLLPRESSRGRVAGVLRAMCDFLVWVRHPDGGFPLLNDGAANGVAAPRQMLAWCAEHAGWQGSDNLPRGGKLFADVGLAVWHGKSWSVFFNVGAVGPARQPGHAHADTLTVEVSFAGQRLVVDPGTYGYDADARRAYDRATSSHNTICVDDEDSSEMWAIFRVGRRARVHDLRPGVGPDSFHVSAAHDGYRFLRGAPRHERLVRVEHDETLSIEDTVRGSARHEVAGGFLLAPGWQAEQHAAGWTLTGPAGRLRVGLSSSRPVAITLSRAPYHPDYGTELETTRIGWRYEGPLPLRVCTLWERCDT